MMTAESWKEPNNKARVLNERIQDIHSKRSGVDNHGNKAHHEKHAVDDCIHYPTLLRMLMLGGSKNFS